MMTLEKQELERTIDAIGSSLIETYHIKTLRDTKEMYFYSKNGVYEPHAEEIVEQTVRQQVDRNITKHDLSEILYYIQTMTYTGREEFDNDLTWLHFGNGWVNPQTREFRNHSPEQLSLFKIPHNYNPEAKNPAQLQFFTDIFEEADLPVVQKFFGYLLLPDQRYKKAFLGIGPKDTGKSKFAELAEKFAGMVSHVSLHDMDRHNHNVVKITGSILNTASEISKYKLKYVSVFKAITGGDESTFRKIYGEPFNARVRSKILVVTNDKPNFDDMDQTFIERWIVFKFTNVFKAGEDMDTGIMERLTTPEEMSGLVNWALEGLAMLQKDGYFKIQSWEDIKTDWDSLDSKIAEYHKSHIIKKQGVFIPTRELYADYCKHTEAPLSDAMFGRELKKLGVKRSKQRYQGKPVNVYEDITIEGKENVPCVPWNFEYVTHSEECSIEEGTADSVEQVEQGDTS